MPEIVTADVILDSLKLAYESNRQLDPKRWLDAAFKLNLLLGDEHERLENLRLEVAQKKHEILSNQEKRNVAAAEIEIEATELYRDMRIQEHKVDQINQFIMIAKKNSDQF